MSDANTIVNPSPRKGEGGTQTTAMPEAYIGVQNVDGLLEYVCTAAPGVVASDAKWRIKKLIYSAEVDPAARIVIQILWADGDAKYDNVATDPASLSYS